MFMQVFGQIFFGNAWVKWEGTRMTLNELMIMHRVVFNIVNNMHELMCKGSKDYR